MTTYRELVSVLDRVRSRVRARGAWRGALTAVGEAAAAVLVVVVALALAGPHRWLVFATLLALAGVLLWRFAKHVLLPFSRFPRLRDFAARVDGAAKGPRNGVINAVDLGARRDQEADPLSRELIDRVVVAGLEPASRASVAELDHSPSPRRGLLLIGAAAVGLVLVSLGVPERARLAWLALIHPVSFPYSPPFQVDVTPGDGSVDVGGTFKVSAAVTGTEKPATVVYRREGGAWKGLDMVGTSREVVPWKGPYGTASTPERPVPKLGYELALDDLRQNTEYRVRVGGWESPLYSIEALSAPRIARFEIITDAPAYSGLADEVTQALVGGVTALAGSRVSIALETDGAIDRTEIEWSGGRTSVAGTDDHGRPSFSWTMAENDAYRVRLVDHAGRTRYESPSYVVNVVPDAHPLVRIDRPGEDVALPEGGELPVQVSCADDFGLTRLVLHVRKESFEPTQRVLREFAKRAKNETVAFTWDLSSLDLAPGDRAIYYVELFDNDTVNGPKAARSPDYEIRFPTDEELLAAARTEYAEDVVGSLDDVYEAEKQIAEKLEAARQEIERSRTGVSWEQRQEVEGLLETQSAIQQQLQQAMDALEQSVEQLSESEVADYQMLERMDAIHSLLDEIDDERLQTMMQQVRDALQQMDQQQLQQAMKAMNMSQEEMLQQLDRSLEHLEQVLAEQKLDAVLDQVREMMEEQAAISDAIEKKPGEESAKDDLAKTPSGSAEANEKAAQMDEASKAEENNGAKAEEGKDAKADEAMKADSQNEADAKGEEQADAKESKPNSPNGSDPSQSGEQKESATSGSKESKDGSGSPPDQELAERQQALAEQAGQLSESIDELQKLAAQKHQRMSKALDSATPKPKMKQAQNEMESAENELQQQKRKNALRYTLAAQNELQALMNDLQGAMQMMQNNQMQELQEKLVAIGAGLLHLSNKQEDIVTEDAAAPTRELAEGEDRLYDATGRASEDLNDIGKETLFVSQAMLLNMGKVLDDMNAATSGFETGSRSRAQKQAGSALNGLNKAVMDIIRAKQQMSSSSSSCSNPNPSAMSRIPNLSGMQQQLNQETLSLREQLSRGRLSPQSGQDALKQLAARQEAIRRGLEEISGELKGRRDVLGRLDELGKDVEDVTESLKQGNVDRTLIERQEKILDRLLAAEKSIRKQGEDDRRVSRTGKDPGRTAPPAPLTQEAIGKPQRVQQEIMQGRSDPFPARYRSLIDAYFKALSGGGRGDDEPAAPAEPAESERSTPPSSTDRR